MNRAESDEKLKAWYVALGLFGIHYLVLWLVVLRLRAWQFPVMILIFSVLLGWWSLWDVKKPVRVRSSG